MSKPDLSVVGGVTLAPGLPGQLVESGPPDGAITAMNENATAVDFGQVVVRGTAVAAGAVMNCKPQTADGDLILGVSERTSQPIASTDGNNTVNYPRYAAVPVRKRGRIYCVPCENVVAGTLALVITAGTGSKIASTTGGAAGAGRIAFPTGGAVWETTTSSGALGILSLNLA